MVSVFRVLSTFLGALTVSLTLVGESAAQTSCTVSPSSPTTASTTGVLRVTAKNVPLNVVRMVFPTWGASGGQDDLVWYQGTNAGNGMWYADVDLARHKAGAPEFGRFDTHVYATTNTGVESLCGATTWVRESQVTPSCSSAAPALPSTSSTSGSFRIYAYGVSGAQSMSFPTWGDVGGGDDLVWYPGVSAGGGTWYADVDLSRHKPGNPEYGNFQTHVYVRSATGDERLCAAVTWQREQQAAPSCSVVAPSAPSTLAASGLFRVYAHGVRNAQSVKFPTWGSSGDQDDLVWYEGVSAGNGTWYADVNLANHKPGQPEYGEFNTHVHVTSGTGATAICGAKWHRPQVLVFRSSNNTQNDGWRDDRVLPDGQLAMVSEIRSAFCSPTCPAGRFRVGISYAVDLLDTPWPGQEQKVLQELSALVASAKANNFYFAIHANHEWVLRVGANPFGVPAADWAEYTNWNEPLNRFWVGWGSPIPEIGLKPNFESSAVRSKIRNDIALISSFIVNNIFTDPAAKALFLGVDFGWETDVGIAEKPDGTASRLGYAALARRINPANGQPFGPGNLPGDFEAELGNVARDFVKFGADEYVRNGVPRSLLFTHLVASEGDDVSRVKRTPLNAARLHGLNLGVSSFGGPFASNRINAERQGGAWTVAETDPHTALAFVNGGAGLPPPAVVTIFTWGDSVRAGNGFGNNVIPQFRTLFATP